MARAAARAAGYDGRHVPLAERRHGREETQQVHLNPQSGRWLPDHSHKQRHVNIAIAYNVWQHYMVTGSTAFLRFTGAELLIEIARFWSSIATYDADAGPLRDPRRRGPGRVPRGLPGLRRARAANNTYTNVMAVWVLQRALEALDVLPPHYRAELVQELTIRRRRAGPLARHHQEDEGGLPRRRRADPVRGLRDLPEFDWEGYRERYGNIQRLDRLLEAEGDSTNRYKLAKQADVLMLLFLLSRDELRELLHGLGYEVSTEQLARTVDYHLSGPRTGRR